MNPCPSNLLKPFEAEDPDIQGEMGMTPSPWQTSTMRRKRAPNIKDSKETPPKHSMATKPEPFDS